MIRVLHVGLSDNIGGIETVVHSWFKRLPDDIHFDFIKTTTNKLAFEDEFISGGSKIYRVPSRKSSIHRSYAEIRRIISENDYDYLHFHAMSLSWPEPILIAVKSGITQGIIHSHMVVDDNMAFKYRVLHRFGKLRLSSVKYYELACGAEAGRSMFGNDKFMVVPNGIELEKFKFSEDRRKAIRNKHSIPDNVCVIGHVGRSGPQKNYPFIIESFSKVIKTDSNYRLLLVGDVEHDQNVQELITKYNCNDKVIFSGHVEDTSSYYSAMDIFFFPSLYEGFSVALVEAQASGLPCVVSKNVSFESRINADFEFVDIHSPNRAVQLLKELPKQNANRRMATDNIPFDINKTANQMIEFYKAHVKEQE